MAQAQVIFDLTWTPAMALAWIVFRDLDEVDAVFRKNQTFLEFGLAVELDNKFGRLGAAEAELWETAFHGEVNALGKPGGEGAPIKIPAHEWAYLRPWDHHHLEFFRNTTTEYNRAYSELRFLETDILKRWPIQKAVAITTRRAPKVSAAQAVTECQRWLEAAIQASPLKRPKSKADYSKEALKKWETAPLSERGFLRAWDNAIETKGASAWSLPGKIPGSANKSPVHRVTKTRGGGGAHD